MSSKIPIDPDPPDINDDNVNRVRSKKKIRKTEVSITSDEISSRNQERLDNTSPLKLDLKRKKSYRESVTGKVEDGDTPEGSGDEEMVEEENEKIDPGDNTKEKERTGKKNMQTQKPGKGL
ncbi:uncharacterized protein G2W53_013665 [Senna tora]|uniref:Uncharacterized protein n=1 Tax=Senna tora TaxID=362788 RepID=A0A834TZP6_9FABA|nr:uncharacterized protein G2W53_013665 [Senna tora]